MPTSPLDVFPDFYSNPAIRSIAPAPRWTVSDSGKRPIDIKRVLDDPGSCAFGVPGATSPTADCLVTLDELTAGLPDAANAAFFVDALEDELVVLDVEHDCPPAVSAPLLRMPALYREASMSGTGYHLVFPLPSVAYDSPGLLVRPRLQDPSRWFEVLQRQYVTFTRRAVPPPPDMLPMSAWDSFYEGFTNGLRRSGNAGTGLVEVGTAMPEHPLNEAFLDALTTARATASLRPLSDFHGDHSRHEFSAIGKLLVRLRRMERSQGVRLDPGHEAWLVYGALTRLLPPRPKHSTLRRGRPLLLDRAAYIIALHDAGKERT